MMARPAAPELPARQVGCKAFVAVYPPPLVDSHSTWRIRRFEISESLIDGYPAEENLIDSELMKLNTLADVERLLTSWGIECSTLDAPWKCNYPL